MKKINIKRKSNLKKVLISSLAVFSLAATGVVSGISVTSNNNNLTYNNSIISKNDSTASTFTPPNANDLYNDYSYTNGFVRINGPTISFYDWFGFNLWNFNVNANAGNLFGNSSLSVLSLKVKSSTDGTQIYVYGYFSNDSSFLFKLNTANGAVVPIGVTNSYSSNLIKDANLLTIVDGTAILTQKTPASVSGSTQTYNISTSEIDLGSGQLTNVSYDITGAKSDRSVVQFGEIIGVQKVDSNYIFDVKAITFNNQSSTTTSQVHPSLLMINEKNNGSGTGSYANNAYSVSFWNYVNSSVSTDYNSILNSVNFCILNVDQTTTQTTYIAAKYSTAPTSYGNSSNTITPAQIYYTTLSGSSAVVNNTPITISSVTNSADTDSIAGVTNFLYDSSSSTPYVVLANGGSNSKIAITNLTTNSTGSAPGWIDLSASKISTSDYQSIDVNFIPGTGVTQVSTSAASVSLGYSGYIDIKQYASATTTVYNESRNFFSINTAGTTITPITNVNYSLGMTDTAISDKYKAGKATASENTVNKLVADLTSVQQDGKSLNVPYANNISLDSKDQTIKGSVVLTLNNWWNSGTSQLTRYVNINLATISVIVYVAIIVGVLAVLAVLMMIIRAIQDKRTKLDSNVYRIKDKSDESIEKIGNEEEE